MCYQQLNNVGIKENLTKIKEQIGSNKVKIIVVTKYASFEQISEAYNLGIRDFGESYIQDALEKISNQDKTLNDPVKWHLIGRLQKNKVKYVLGRFVLIHSVDSVELAEIINKTALQRNITQNVLLQVNISGEESKAGFKKNELVIKFENLSRLPNIKISGLMTIAPKTEDKNMIQNCFLDLADLKGELNNHFKAGLKELSMGMSNDYQIAIECGSTMLRVGRAIFS